MYHNTEIETIRCEGTPLVIHARAFPDEFESYSEWKPRTAPKCPFCESEMTFGVDPDPVDEDDHENYDEYWECDDCGWCDWYFAYDYGEDEIVITEEEWLAEQSINRQQRYLERRYGTQRPKNIRDYWLENPASD